MRSVFLCLKNVYKLDNLVNLFVYISKIINTVLLLIENRCLKVIVNQLDLICYSSMIYTRKLLESHLLSKSFTHYPQGLLLRRLF